MRLLFLFIFAVFSTNLRAETPIESFANLPLLSNPSLSPSGQKFAALASIEGRQNFLIKNISADGGTPILINLAEYDLQSWQWVNEDWLVATIAVNQKITGRTWRVTRTLAIRADGSEINVIKNKESGQNAADILWIASDGRPYIILAYQTSIFSNEAGFWPRVDMIDVSTGKTIYKLAQPKDNVFDWYADANGTVRMGIGRNNRRLSTKLYYREENGDSFKTVDEAKRKDDEYITAPSLFMADPKKAMVYRNNGGFASLYNFSLDDFSVGEKFFSVEGYDISSIITNPAGNEIEGITWVDTKHRVKWFNPDMENIQSSLEKSVPGQSVNIISQNHNRDRFIVRIGNASRPGTYYIFEKNAAKLYKLASVNDKMKLKAYAPVSTISYKARDGLKIEAVLTLPKGADAKNLPLIMMPHGGPHARDYERWDWQVQHLADRGYAVIQPNFRGSSGYGENFSDLGEQQWGLKMQDDLDDGVAHLVREGIADKDKVCIMGGSYGGYAAIRAAQRNPEIYKCAISFAGISDMSDMIRYDGSFLNGKFSKAWLEDQIVDLKTVSPINYAQDFEVPLLLVHGKLDLRVPYKQSETMAKALEKLDKPVRYVEQEKGDHHFSLQSDRVQFLTEVENFLKAHNPSDQLAAQ